MSAGALGGDDAGALGPGGSAALPRPEAAAPPLRGSALVRAARVMWSAAPVALGAIVANTVVQSALMYLDTPSGFSPAFLVAFLVSAAVALGAYGLLTSAALAAAQGSGGSALARFRAGWRTFAGWGLVQWLVMLVVSLVSVYLILVVAILTPFVPLAAMDGERRAMRANLATIRARLGRWLLTSAVLTAFGVVLYLLAVANTLFVQGTPAAVIFWLVIGLVAWWVLTAWALIRRGTGGNGNPR